MRLTQTLPTMAFLFATLIASAPTNPRFDYPGSPDELDKRTNPKFDYPGSPDELDKRTNPRFDYPGSPDELE